MAGSFFKTGSAGRQESEKFEAQQKARAEQMRNMPREFWMSRGETQKVLFLDNPDFYVKRHSIKIRNSYEKVTCIEDMGIGECPGCSQKAPAYCIAATVITLTPVEDAKGNTYVYQKRVLCVSGDSKKYLEKVQDKRGSLQYCIVELSRGTAENSPAVGAYDYEGKISKEGFEKLKNNILEAKTNGDTPIAEYLKPFDYAKVFAPLPIADLHKMFGTSPSASYGANMDDFSTNSNDLLESSASLDESPFGEDTPKKNEEDESPNVGGYGEGEDDLSSDDAPEPENALAGMTDKEILTKMLELGCTIKAAKKMTREEREAWLVEQGFSTQEGDVDLEDMDEEALSAMLKDYGLPEKNIAGMDKEDMIEAIREFQAND